MRKITQQIVEAVKARKSWCNGNTVVTHYVETGSTIVRLHGNKIAEIRFNGELYLTTSGWTKPPTLERLNGLLTLAEHPCRVFIRNKQLFYKVLDDQSKPVAWNGSWQSFGRIRT